MSLKKTIGVYLFYFVLFVLGFLSIYAVRYYNDQGKDDPNAKIYVGLSATYIAIFIVVIILSIVLYVHSFSENERNEQLRYMEIKARRAQQAPEKLFVKNPKEMKFYWGT